MRDLDFCEALGDTYDCVNLITHTSFPKVLTSKKRLIRSSVMHWISSIMYNFDFDWGGSDCLLPDFLFQRYSEVLLQTHVPNYSFIVYYFFYPSKGKFVLVLFWIWHTELRTSLFLGFCSYHDTVNGDARFFKMGLKKKKRKRSHPISKF